MLLQNGTKTNTQIKNKRQTKKIKKNSIAHKVWSVVFGCGHANDDGSAFAVF